MVDSAANRDRRARIEGGLEFKRQEIAFLESQLTAKGRGGPIRRWKDKRKMVQNKRFAEEWLQSIWELDRLDPELVDRWLEYRESLEHDLDLDLDGALESKNLKIDSPILETGRKALADNPRMLRVASNFCVYFTLFIGLLAILDVIVLQRFMLPEAWVFNIDDLPWEVFTTRILFISASLGSIFLLMSQPRVWFSSGPLQVIFAAIYMFSFMAFISFQASLSAVSIGNYLSAKAVPVSEARSEVWVVRAHEWQAGSKEEAPKCFLKVVSERGIEKTFLALGWSQSDCKEIVRVDTKSVVGFFGIPHAIDVELFGKKYEEGERMHTPERKVRPSYFFSIH